ncbi:MAG: aspartate kinase [Candidatus Hydrogenedens sp.]|nr:aspartate kinase [Candidatus Hydrogenedens sp.]
MGDIVCKFGGTSLAEASGIRRAIAIVEADPRRRFVVPSAPGKRTKDDRKVTDLLYAWHNIAQQGLSPAEPRGIIRDRFVGLAAELGADLDIEALLEEIDAEASKYAEPDYMASRGEYLNGRLMAAVMGATFVDPAECIFFDDEGRLSETTYETLGARLQGPGRFVIPGFFGSDPEGNIRTFSRGGSDITGAIVARAADADLYENWTDVSGFLMADPRIVDDPRNIAEITYKELRELSYMGATVLHDEAIHPVRQVKIPINIRNTWAPEHPGTRIVAERDSSAPVCGIAGRDGFTMINIEKAFMNKERGFGLRVMSVLEEFGVSWEHMPTGIDTISLIVKDEALGPHGKAIVEAIQIRCTPDEVSLTPGLAIIATVGQGMNHHIGVAARLFTSLAKESVNIRLIDQGSSEMNIIIGVEAEDLPRAVRAIYGAFSDWTV